jgi:hypothetical protein
MVCYIESYLYPSQFGELLQILNVLQGPLIVIRKLHLACSVIDTARTMHVVSLIPHAKLNFQTTSKSMNRLRNGIAM